MGGCRLCPLSRVGIENKKRGVSCCVWGIVELQSHLCGLSDCEAVQFVKKKIDTVGLELLMWDFVL